jgi:hypothetical protein
MRVVVLLLATLALSAFIGCQAKPMVVSESGSGQEGFTVHGNWTVEVTNPDGSLVARKQFSNKFTGQHIVAALLSLDLETTREMRFVIRDSLSDKNMSNPNFVACEEEDETIEDYLYVPAKAILASNDDGEMHNSVWNASCTLKINGNEPKYLSNVFTRLRTSLYPTADSMQGFPTLTEKELDEFIEVWDGQVVAATVILSVE